MGFHEVEIFPFQKIPRNLLANKTQVTPLRAPGLNVTLRGRPRGTLGQLCLCRRRWSDADVGRTSPPSGGGDQSSPGGSRQPLDCLKFYGRTHKLELYVWVSGHPVTLLIE